ncbi:MAG: HAD family hydrolase [Verrucomicrobiia bacterium]
MATSFKLIVTDFDGTIFQEFENPPIPLQFQEKIIELQKSNVRWVINTGRDLTSVLELLARSRAKVYPDYIVAVEREIYVRAKENYEPAQEWNALCKSKHEKLFKKVRPFLGELTGFINKNFSASLYSDPYSPLCIIAENNGVMDKICDYLNGFRKNNIPDLAVMRNDVYARFCHKDFNKGTATKEIARMLNLTPDHVFAAGDHLNDLDMLDKNVARYLAAPANALDTVKNRVLNNGGYVSELPSGYGVLDSIEFFLKMLERH